MPTPELSPQAVVQQISGLLSDESRNAIIIIGSLAAAYYFSERGSKVAVRTKDVDCMLSPPATAALYATEVTRSLLEGGWKYRPSAAFPTPGTASTPVEQLPVGRFVPPNLPTDAWFIELLSSPDAETSGKDKRSFTRISSEQGDFALCSFGFLGLIEDRATTTPFGLRVAAPSMMALSNLLHHPIIKRDLIGGGYLGRPMKRSNKDLGRVLTLAWLTEEIEPDQLMSWTHYWRSALAGRFDQNPGELLRNVGSGLRELLASPEDLEQAAASCNNGLLGRRTVREESLTAVCRRFIKNVIEPAEALGSNLPLDQSSLTKNIEQDSVNEKASKIGGIKHE